MSREDLGGRVLAWLLERGEAGWIEAGGPSRLALCEQWRDVSTTYGAESPPALGSLLALVREAWGDPTISAAPVPSFDHGCSWRISMTGYDHERLMMNLGGRLWRLTEAEALVAALEAAPK